MSQAPLERYDFAASERVKRPLRQQLDIWSEKASEIFIQQWQTVSESEIKVSAKTIDAHSFVDIQESWENPCSGAEIGFRQNTVRGQMIIENQQLRVLLMDILKGDDTEDGHRDLTPIESSLASLIFELIAVSFSEGWQEQEPLEFDLKEFDPAPERNRLFAADKKVLICGFEIELNSRSAVMHLLVACNEMAALFGIDPMATPERKTGQRISPNMISKINIKLDAELGFARLDMTDLVGLSAGDIIILEQSVREPVAVRVNGEVLFHAWPGKQLNQQVLKIDSMVE